MADLQELPELVRALAVRYGGHLIVVSPKGTGGNPWDAPFLEAVTLSPAGLELVLDGGQTRYLLEDPVVLSQDEDELLLAGASLVVTVVPDGSDALTSGFGPAELLLTADPKTADRRGRTRGRRLEEPRGTR